MPKLVLYHATTQEFDEFDLRQTVDGGLHFGTLTQARMRGGPRSRLIEAEVTLERPAYCRDLGGNWKAKIKSARSRGKDGIIYLNRYEGLSAETLERALSQNLNLDRLSDAQFRRHVPEAENSCIVFNLEQVKILKVLPPAAPRPLEPLKSLPRAKIGSVTHVGTLRLNDKEPNSHEGQGLSFSQDPDIWVRFARLGEQPHWQTDLSARRLIDVKEALKAPERVQALKNWALEQGWCEEKEAWHVFDLDAESDTWSKTSFLDPASAEKEKEGLDEDAFIEKAPALIATEKMKKAMGWSLPALAWVNSGDLLNMWAREQAEWDGLWWDAPLDPARMTAPRGVLFPRSVDTSAWKCVSGLKKHARARP